MENEKLVITPDMVISDVIRLKPQTIQTLMTFGMGCIGCPASQMETLEEAAMVHGVDIDYLIDRLNA